MTRVMDMPALPPGYWWVNVAPVGEKPRWEQQPMPTGGNPNDEPTLFGYRQGDFLRKQYR